MEIVVAFLNSFDTDRYSSLELIVEIALGGLLRCSGLEDVSSYEYYSQQPTLIGERRWSGISQELK